MEKKQMKVSFKTAVIFVIIAAIIVISTLVVLYINDRLDKEILLRGGTTTPVEVENTEMSLKFLKKENEKKNMIYSPLSIKYALKMLNEGADGNTKKQIEDLIGTEVIQKYNNIEKVLSLANAVYIRDTYSKYVTSEYKNILMGKYNAEVKNDSFKDASNINKWIEDKTFKQIKNMLEDEMVADPLSKMILVNALAIDMEWKNQFDTEHTTGKDFYLENGAKMNATTMNQKTSSDDIAYYKDSNYVALSMDLEEYENTQLQFLAIMPDKDLSEYIDKFSITELEKITKNLKLASKEKNGLNISIPKFSYDYDLKLKADLQAFGITDAFDGELADFHKMTNKEEKLYVGDALHKANIDFTEKGVKAAAVTVMLMKEFASAEQPIKPVEIKIDKPFLYIIRDKKTNEIWFVGTVYEPNSWEKDKTEYR